MKSIQLSKCPARSLLVLGVLCALGKTCHAEWAPGTTLTLETDVPRILRRAAEKGARPMVSPELEKRILAARQGDIVEMGDFDMEPLPLLNLVQNAGGPPMLFADDPEYIRVPEGAVLRERINPGVHRFYLYHVNATTGTLRKISTVIENLGEKPMQLRFHKRSFPGVSLDYVRLGKEGIRGFFTASPDKTSRTIPAGAAVPLDEEVERSVVKFDELIHAWYEFETDQPSRVTVVQTDPATPSPVAAARIEKLLPPRSKSGAGRGFYPYSEYELQLPTGQSYDTGEGPRQIFIADGRNDKWITGFDSTSPEQPVVQKGNYGIVYRIKVRRSSSDGRALALLTWNARTKSGCKAMGGCTQVNAGQFPAGPVMVPTGQIVIKGGDKAVLLQVFPPLRKGKTGEIEILYTPPGASCLPTPLLLLPISQDSK